jgi:hypothetical protein
MARTGSVKDFVELRVVFTVAKRSRVVAAVGRRWARHHRHPSAPIEHIEQNRFTMDAGRHAPTFWRA